MRLDTNGMPYIHAVAICGNEIDGRGGARPPQRATFRLNMQSPALWDKRIPAGSRICRFAAKCSGRTCTVIVQCRHRGPPKIPDTYDEYYIVTTHLFLCTSIPMLFDFSPPFPSSRLDQQKPPIHHLRSILPSASHEPICVPPSCGVRCNRLSSQSRVPRPPI